LFYVNGNGYEWKNGTLQRIGFRAKTKKDYVETIIDEEMKSCKRHQAGLYPIDHITKHDIESLQIAAYKTTFKRLITYIERIENAEKLAEDFTPQKDFKFYPICKYSKCMNIPDDIQPDWLEGINSIKN
jgi:molecular chaperone GrpE (heat shock protein)